jgi:hypothetical protein
MSFDITRLKSMELESPATESVIKLAEQQLGVRFPVAYRSFLLAANGGEGFVGERYLMLWRVEQLAELNMQYRVSEFMPGMVVFGSSGGGTAYGFDTRNMELPIVKVEFVGLGWKDSVALGNTFDEFLVHLETPETPHESH